MKGEEILERVVGYVGENWEMYDEINDAYQTIVRSAPFREFRFRDDAALAFEPNDTTYLIPSFVRRLESVWVRETSDHQEWNKIEFVDDGKFERKVFAWRNSDGSDNTDTPRYARISGNLLEVAPTPNAAYPMRLVYIGDPPVIKRLSVPQLPESYHLTIAKMAAVRILAMPKTGIGETDYVQRVAARNALLKEINIADLAMTFDMANNITGSPQMPKRRMMRT